MMLPLWGFSSPAMVFSVVDLPAPLAPIRVTISPFVHLEGDALDGVDAAVINVEIIYLQQSVAHTPPSFFLPR